MAALPTPGPSDVWGANLNAAIESVTTQGLAASLPASGDFEGQVYSATDTGEVWRWDGTTWTIWALALPEGTADGDVPVWDATAGLWVPGTGGGGGGGTGDAAWTVVGAGGGAPAFANGWTNFGGSYNGAAFRKDGQGFVHLRGVIKSGSLTNTAFTLPAGYRPANTEVFGGDSNGGYGQTLISSAGLVQPYGGSTTAFSLSGMTFYAEN